jgi:hypothetical protein
MDDATAGREGDPLVPDADAENGNYPRANRVAAHAEVALSRRVAGAGRDDDVVEPPVPQLVPRDTVVPHDVRLDAVDLREQLEEVERVRVVVVDQERLRNGSSS